MQSVSALLATLLLLPLLLRGEPELSSVSDLVDESGACQCTVYLPKSSIILQRLEELQSAMQELFSKYELKLSRARELVHASDHRQSQALDVIGMRESRNSSLAVLSYENSVFDQLHLELERMKKLAGQLMAKGRVNKESAGLLHQLNDLAMNVSLALKLLSNADLRSFVALQHEVDSLEQQLSECEREKEHQQTSRYTGAHQPAGSCVHGVLQRVSRPLVVQLNWRGLPYKAGAWGQDSAPNSNSSLHWVAPLSKDGRYFDYYRLYESYDDLMLLQKYEEFKMGYGDGSGNTVYQNFMYFNYYRTANMAKVDLSSNTLVLQRPLPGATFNNCFSYAGVPWMDLDFAGDEKGLWVLYATERSKGNLVVSLLNTSTLAVERTWYTSQYRPGLSGAFMACGVLYALRSLSTRQEEIFYAFDTATGKETHLSILLDKTLETLHGINYCPMDHKLYVYNDAFLVNYDLTFPTQKHRLQRPLAQRPVKSSKLSSP
ncbi:olfactomedin-4 [Octodon degus]|uniref:Olfactomedin-4 n=1 Tax=Octodon degus TaxID=10160 RepID=A0A6P3FAS5_OCTDE|nr:olfactomedin-4 [Octodon degus]